MKTRFWIGLAVLVSAILNGGGTAYADGLYGCLPTGCSLCAVEPSAFTGYFASARSPIISMRTKAPGGLSAFSVKYPLKGLWSEVVVPINGAYAGVVVGGGYLFNRDTESETDYTMTAPSNYVTSRKWRSSAQLFNLRLALTRDLSPWLSLVGGIRGDFFQTKGENPHSDTANPIGTHADASHMTFAAYLPFVGFMGKTADLGGRLTLNAGVVGFPFMWGSINYLETASNLQPATNSGGIRIAGWAFPGLQMANEFRASGYFLESFADCSLKLGCVSLGAFFKCDILNGSTKVNPGERLGSIGYYVDDSLASYTLPKVDFDLKFQTYNYMVGGQLGMAF